MIANKAGLSLLYDTLDELVESGEMTEEEARDTEASAMQTV